MTTVLRGDVSGLNQVAVAPLNTVMQWLDTSADGLSTSEASARLCRVGPNSVRIHQVSALAVLKRQLNNAALGLLAATAVLSPCQSRTPESSVMMSCGSLVTAGDGVTIEQIACDFGVHSMMLSKWMRQADIDDGTKSGSTTSDSAELRELRRRSRLLELENEVLRQAAAHLSQSNLPGKGFTRS